jgi:GTP pyrophosphokinase
MQLLELGYEADAVVVGILHDLIEDTNTTGEDIEKEFGSKTAKDVLAVSFKSEIADYVEQYQEMFKRTVEAGRIPIVVKAADLYANSIYIHLIPSVTKQRQVLGKSPYFLELTETLADEPVLIELKKRYEQEDSRLKKLESNLS